ncbi:hypothetical protein P9186_13165, partial [Bacillus safensis]
FVYKLSTSYTNEVLFFFASHHHPTKPVKPLHKQSKDFFFLSRNGIQTKSGFDEKGGVRCLISISL